MLEYKSVFSDNIERGCTTLEVNSDVKVVNNVRGSYDYLYKGICFAQRVGRPDKEFATQLVDNAILGIGYMGKWTHEKLGKAIDMAKTLGGITNA